MAEFHKKCNKSAPVKALLTGTRDTLMSLADLVALAATSAAEAELRDVKLAALQLVQRFLLLCGEHFHGFGRALIAELGSRSLIEAAGKQIALLLSKFHVERV